MISRRCLQVRPSCSSRHIWPRVEAASAIVAEAARSNVPVYGINTGFGKLASKRIPPDQTALLQRNLIVSHCCGVGPVTPEPIVRLMIALKIVSLGRGASGVRREIIEQLQAMLARGVYPLVPQQGSVGASGDLAPLAHMTAVMIGEGQALIGGKIVPGRDALAAAGLEAITLGPKEGLALINGTQFSTAYAISGLLRAHGLVRAALVTGALSVDAAMASTAPFRPEIQQLRGQAGQIAAGAALTALLDGSDIRMSHLEGDERVQDPYCLRCQPQVAGAALDLLIQAARTLTIEANAVTDNPLVLVETGEIVSGGNFHAEPVAFAADQIALALSEIGAISERRIATLVDPALNFGLPPFLTPEPGVNSGFMIAEVTAAALYAENKQRATACSIELDADQRQPGRSRLDGCARGTPLVRYGGQSGYHSWHRAAGGGARHRAARAAHDQPSACGGHCAIARGGAGARRRSLHGRRSRQRNRAGRSRRIAGGCDFGASRTTRFQTLPREVFRHEPPTGQRPHDPRAPRV